MPREITRGRAELVSVRRPPAGQRLPVVFDCPHSGRFYPEDFGSIVTVERLQGYEDRFVDDLFADAPDHGVSLVTANFARAYIDPNRALADLDQGLLAAEWPEALAPTINSERGVGLIFRVMNDSAPIYDRMLSLDEVKARIESCWIPYHDALGEALDEACERAGAVWHLNCHSMRPVGDALSPDPGVKRKDMVLGDLEGKSCDPAFTDFVEGTLKDLGYSVAVNDPYKGAYLVERNGHPERGRHSLQIEINRALYMDMESLERTADFASLKADMARLAERIGAFARERAG